MIENWVQQNRHQKENVAKQQKEYLQIFFLVLQVCSVTVFYHFSKIRLYFRKYPAMPAYVIIAS